MGDRDLSGYERNRLWLQLPPEKNELRFAEVAEESGVSDLYNGRGVSLLDADNDGDVDVYIANQGKAGTFYRNLLYGTGRRDSSHWLGLNLVGDPGSPNDRDGLRLVSSADAVSARAVVSCRGKAQRRDVQGGTSFAAQSDRRLFFGLGACAQPESITIFWPSGRVQEFDQASALAMVDRMTRVEEKALAASAR